jgi:hypothetical protein
MRRFGAFQPRQAPVRNNSLPAHLARLDPSMHVARFGEGKDPSIGPLSQPSRMPPST